MVTTVTLNPCIDQTILINNMVHGGLNIVEKTRQDLGGKGINVSIALKNLDIKNTILTFGFLESLKLQEKSLANLEVESILIKSNGKLRNNIKIFEETTQTMTEFNEKGEVISKNTLKELEDKIIEYSNISEIIVFGGSLCPGIPEDFYRTIITKCKKENPNINVILDASGNPFIEGLKANPDLIKPNLFELETAFKIKLNSTNSIISISKKIINNGVKIVCTSMGKDGAMIVSKDQAFKIQPPQINVKSAQGAGDSLVSGLCYGILNNHSVDKILCYGVAMASATIMREGTLMGTKEDFTKILNVLKPIIVN